MLIALGCLLGILAIAELVFRLSNDFGYVVPAKTAAASRRAGHPLFAGQAWRKEEFVFPEQNNADGYRSEEFTARADSPRRIAIIGDSFVQANQVPFGSSFVAVAEAELDSVQLLGLGRGARYLPESYRFFRDRFDVLFGESGKYPEVDAVVFCTRQFCLESIIHRDRDYGLVYPDLRIPRSSPRPGSIAAWWDGWKERAIAPTWRLDWKRGAVRHGLAMTDRGVLGPSHALSYFSYQAGSWIRADWENTVMDLYQGAAKIFTPTRVDANPAERPSSVDAASPVRPSLSGADAALEEARVMYRDQVVKPLMAACAARGLPVAFVYLTSNAEALGPDDPAAQRTRNAILSALRESGAHYVDTLPYMTEPSAMYWRYDKHPNEAGHAAFARALVDVTRGDLLPRLEPPR